MQNQIEVKLSGATLGEVVEHATAFIKAAGGVVSAKAALTKVAKTKVVEESFLGGDEGEESEVETEVEENEVETEVEEIEEPPTKAAKAKKPTDKDLNAAAMKYAKKHGRPATVKLLKMKFKVESFLELKADQYAAVIKALAV